MNDTDIICEIRAIREAFAAEHNYDIRAMVRALREMDIASGTPVVSFAKRRTANESHFEPADLSQLAPVSDQAICTPADAA